ncbi:MAG: NAD-dependent epimerase/dehydratase family protein [Candidatus Nanohaloarchaea archaeon]
MEKALVTGGAGFIGSNIVEELVERGVETVVLDDLYLGEEDNLSEVRDEITFVEGSVLNREKVEEAIQGCDTVFHQAARSSSPMHQDNPREGARVNVEGFVTTAEAAIEENVKKIVYASTSSMYGSVEPPHSEDMGEIPTNLYTASKMSRERYAQVYSYNDRIQTTGLRYFSVYGPHEKGKGKYANIVTQFLWKMMDGERPVIWGDGSQTRDFTFVEDVVKANMLAAERKDELDGEYFNIGTGRDVSFSRVVEKLNEALGTDIEPEHVENPRDKYVQATKADISKARERLGYEPDYSFEEGLEKAVKYYSNQA